MNCDEEKQFGVIYERHLWTAALAAFVRFSECELVKLAVGKAAKAKARQVTPPILLNFLSW